MYSFCHRFEYHKQQPLWIKEFFKKIYSNKDLEFFSYNFVDIGERGQNLYRCIKAGSIGVVGIMHENPLCFYRKNYPFSILLSEIL